MEISEKEFAVIQAIHSDKSTDQRNIAVKAGISLGLANLLIKRLISKGYVKALQLNQKKIQYILTPQGFSEKTRKSYAYTLKTISLIRSIKHRLLKLILEQHEKGAHEFEIYGENTELFDIVEMLFKGLTNLTVTYKIHHITDSGTFRMTCKYDKESAEQTIDLIEYLSNSGMFWQ